MGRRGRYAVGDLVEFHGWAGRPYWSPWSDRTGWFELKEVTEVIVAPGSLEMWQEAVPEDGTIAQWLKFPWKDLDRLAERDGIVPATGHELRKVLTGLHGMDPLGSPGDILEW